MKNIFFFFFSLCGLGIAEDDGAIIRVLFSQKSKGYTNTQFISEITDAYKVKETPLIKKAAKQLEEYFNGKRKTFNLPIAPQGTEFQLKVWQALLKIPYGETRSYGEIGISIGNPKAYRAVGMANNRNPIVIIIPCHRVIGSKGDLTGFGGGLELKRKLLELEQGC
jgi:methylated-DNA-[protein]-cysteine S-methyltransferase